MDLINEYSSPAVGIGAGYAAAPYLPPVASVAIGAVVTGLLILVGAAGRRRFAVAGSLYTVGLGVLYGITGAGAETYQQTAMVSLLAFGGLSTALVVLRVVFGGAIRRLAAKAGSEETAGAFWQFISAVSGLVTIIWTVLTAHEKAVRYGGVGIVGSATFVAGLLGIEIPIPVWFLTEGLDATVLLYVGTVVAGFWTLESARGAAAAAKATGKVGVAAGKKGAKAGATAGKKTKAAAENVKDRND